MDEQEDGDYVWDLFVRYCEAQSLKVQTQNLIQRGPYFEYTLELFPRDTPIFNALANERFIRPE